MPTKTIPAAQVQLLSESESSAYDKHFESLNPGMPFDMSTSVLAGSIGMREDILERAARVTHIFHKVCRALHAAMRSDESLRRELLRPLEGLPGVQEAAMSSPFFMKFFRLDFFLQNENLHIMEANSGGASLTDFHQCISFLKQYHQFKAPPGFQPLEVPTMLKCILEHCKQHEIKSLGFAAIENGVNDYLWEYLEYAEWMQKNSDVRPILLELTKGNLSCISHREVPCQFTSLSELDCVFTDWFEDLPALERIESNLKELSIRTIPSRSDVLFESKNFLSLLQKIDRPSAISEDEWSLLQNCLLPSFHAEELYDHLEEIKEWPGVVLKMDIDCASENVFLYDFEEMKMEDVIKEIVSCHPERSASIRQGCDARRRRATWSLQKLIHPPTLPMTEPTPDWIGYPYEPYKFDLMTYMCIHENKPHVVFGSRLFSREKWDELTEEGREDGLFCPVSTL